jgi:hypothetical protein
VSLLRGPFGSYPNFLFEIDACEAAAFVAALRAVADDAGFEAFAGRCGVRRTDPRIWPAFDWLHEHARRSDATDVGLYDLGRYGNWHEASRAKLDGRRDGAAQPGSHRARGSTARRRSSRGPTPRPR